jgi:hypothetical protein
VSARGLAALAWLACAAAAQLLPHPAGASPTAALALFAGGCARSHPGALALALGGPALAALVRGIATGDFAHGFHVLAPVVYGSWALSALLGRTLRGRPSAAAVAAASVAGSLLFFGLTNFAVWAVLGTYPRSGAGLAACYLAGLPLLARGLLGDLLCAGLLFGGRAWLAPRMRWLRAHARAGPG